MAALARRKSAVQTDEAVTKDAKVNMRMDSRARDLIDMAAHSQGKTRTEFVLESSLERARDTLLERCLFPLESQQFKAFTDALDKPLPPNSELKKLMRRRPLWQAE